MSYFIHDLLEEDACPAASISTSAVTESGAR
jgi:hypothetical protein